MSLYKTPERGQPLSDSDYEEQLEEHIENGDSRAQVELMSAQNLAHLDAQQMHQQAAIDQWNYENPQPVQEQQELKKAPIKAQKFMDLNNKGGEKAYRAMANEATRMTDEEGIDWENAGDEDFNKLANRMRRKGVQAEGMSQSEQNTFTQRDRRGMENFDLNPDDKTHRAEWMRSKRARLLEED